MARANSGKPAGELCCVRPVKESPETWKTNRRASWRVWNQSPVRTLGNPRGWEGARNSASGLTLALPRIEGSLTNTHECWASWRSARERITRRRSSRPRLLQLVRKCNSRDRQKSYSQGESPLRERASTGVNVTVHGEAFLLDGEALVSVVRSRVDVLVPEPI